MTFYFYHVILLNFKHELFDIERSCYKEEEMIDILSGFQRYCATRYSKFKNELKGHLKKHGELRGPNSISAEHWSKFVEYSKNPYIQIIKYLMVIFTL